MAQNLNKYKISNKKNIRNEIFLVLGMMIIVFFISVNHINESNGIKVYGDEIGYWENAALLTGRDWSGEASLNIYYGYGYGFLLAPILILFNNNPAGMMHAAIILQGVLLSSCVLASWLTLKKVNMNISWKYRMVMSLFSVLYSSNIFYVKFTLSEILLTTCIWWISYLALCYIKNRKKVQGLGIILLSTFMFSVHQRMITMLLTCILLVLFVSLLNSSNTKITTIKKVLAIIFVFLILICICKMYDSYYINKVYSYAADGGRETNRIDANAKKVLLTLMSLKGITSVILSFCGKLFYSFIGTYGFVLIGVYSCIYFIVKYIKTKDNFDNTIWCLYILLNYMAAIGVASLAMRAGFETRSDLLIYGRYSEYTYGPILLASTIYLYTLRKGDCKRKFIGLIIMLSLCLVCFNYTSDNASNSHFWLQCVAMADLRAIPEVTNKEVILIASLRGTCIAGILIIIERFPKNIKNYLLNIVLLAVIISWIYTANINWNKNVLSWYTPLENAMYDIVDGMENEKDFITLDATLAGCMQFLLPNASLHPYTDIEEVLKYGNGCYVITNISSEYIPYIREYFVVDKENDRYLRWKYE